MRYDEHPFASPQIGQDLTFFLQMLYIAFLFPWCMKHFENAHNTEEGAVLSQG